MLEQPINRIIYKAIQDLADDFLGDIYPSFSVDEYLEMARHPIAGAALDIYALLAKTYVGTFSHENETIQDFIRLNFSSRKTNLKEITSSMMSFLFLGWAVAEHNHADFNPNWHTTGIQLIDPRDYHFVGQNGVVTGVMLDVQEGQEIIPYEKCVHVTYGSHLAFNSPYGYALANRFRNLHKAWGILMNELLLAGQREASPTLVGYAKEGDAVLFDQHGNPIRSATGEQETERKPNVWILGEAMKNLQSNGDILVTQEGNEVESLDNETTGDLFKIGLDYIGMLMLVCLLTPETTLLAGKGSLGNGGVSHDHTDLLSFLIESSVDTILDAILEGPISDLIRWNFGEQESYGSFTKPKTGLRDRAKILTAAANLVERSVAGLNDLAVINQIRSLLGVGLLTQEEFDTAKQEALEVARARTAVETETEAASASEN